MNTPRRPPHHFWARISGHALCPRSKQIPRFEPFCAPHAKDVCTLDAVRSLHCREDSGSALARSFKRTPTHDCCRCSMALVAGRLRGLSVALVALEHHLGAWRGFASQSRGRLWPSAMRTRAATPVAQPHRPLKGTILRVEPDFWEVEVPGTGSGQVRKQHMVQPGRPGQQVTVYALQASPLGGLGEFGEARRCSRATPGRVLHFIQIFL